MSPVCSVMLSWPDDIQLKASHKPTELLNQSLRCAPASNVRPKHAVAMRLHDSRQINEVIIKNLYNCEGDT